MSDIAITWRLSVNFYILIFLSETIGPIETELGFNVHWMFVYKKKILLEIYHRNKSPHGTKKSVFCICTCRNMWTVFFSTNINFFPLMFLIHFSFMWYAYKWKIFFLPLSFRITFFSPYIEYMFCLLNSSYSFQTRSCLFYRTCIHTCTCTIFMDYDFVSSFFFFTKLVC